MKCQMPHCEMHIADEIPRRFCSRCMDSSPHAWPVRGIAVSIADRGDLTPDDTVSLEDVYGRALFSMPILKISPIVQLDFFPVAGGTYEPFIGTRLARPIASVFDIGLVVIPKATLYLVSVCPTNQLRAWVWFFKGPNKIITQWSL